MKKVIALLMLILFSVSTVFADEGQFWIGGFFCYDYSKVDNDSVTTYYIVPEVGFDIDDDWGFGFDFIYRHDKGSLYEIPIKDKIDTYGIEPFVRYNLFEYDGFNVYIKGSIFYKSSQYDKVDLSPDAYGGAIVPVLSYMVSSNCTVTATINVLQLEYVYMHCKSYESNDFCFNLNSGVVASVGFNYYFDVDWD